MENFITAFATDDGENYITRHFGDANYYDIYDMTSDKCVFIKRIENGDFEEEFDGDPKKAGNIASILLKENVKVVVSKAFGPNINRIKKKFVCILSNEFEIKKTFVKVQKLFPKIIEEWEKGENRTYLNLRKFQ